MTSQLPAAFWVAGFDGPLAGNSKITFIVSLNKSADERH